MRYAKWEYHLDSMNPLSMRTSFSTINVSIHTHCEQLELHVHPIVFGWCWKCWISSVITFQEDDSVEMHFVKSGECRVSHHWLAWQSLEFHGLVGLLCLMFNCKQLVHHPCKQTSSKSWRIWMFYIDWSIIVLYI